MGWRAVELSAPRVAVPPAAEGRRVAQVAAVAFLARYNGRALDADRQDLRGFFDWAGMVGLEVLNVRRPHPERRQEDAAGVASVSARSVRS